MVSKGRWGRTRAPRWYPEFVPFGIQLWELFLLLLVVLLVFGPKRLPEMGRSLGRGMREFKDSVSGKDTGDDLLELQVGQDDQPVRTKSRERDTVA